MKSYEIGEIDDTEESDEFRFWLFGYWALLLGWCMADYVHQRDSNALSKLFC